MTAQSDPECRSKCNTSILLRGIMSSARRVVGQQFSYHPRSVVRWGPHHNLYRTLDESSPSISIFCNCFPLSAIHTRPSKLVFPFCFCHPLLLPAFCVNLYLRIPYACPAYRSLLPITFSLRLSISLSKLQPFITVFPGYIKVITECPEL